MFLNIQSLLYICLLFIITEQRAKRKRAGGDLSKSGLVQSQMLFFGTELLEEEIEPYKRRLLNEDEQLDEGHTIPFREANKMIQEFLKSKAIMNHGHRALQKRIAREFFKEKKVAEKTDIPVRILHDAVSTDEILYFANRWTAWMYFDLLKELSMYKEGMTIQEAYKEADTFGLSFQTYRMLKNEEPNWDEGWWDHDWFDDDDKKDDPNRDWVKEMEEEMRKMKEEHEQHFKEFDKTFEKEFGKSSDDDEVKQRMLHPTDQNKTVDL